MSRTSERGRTAPPTVITKALVAVSGLLLWGWVVAHLAGNLTLFVGRAAADGYAARLHAMPGLLWTVRLGLLVSTALHVSGVTLLARRARRARPRHAPPHPTGVAALAARSMRMGGALLLAFVAFHLGHLTFGALQPAFRPEHPYENVVAGLHPPAVAAVYLAASLLVGLHLYHGLWSARRSLGLGEHRAPRLRRPVVAVLAAALGLGFASLPLAVLAGALR
jgi:succinate dehydrogenase / fumarate reductase cytochrome b subunit